MGKKYIYIAAPLFNEFERNRNAQIKSRLRLRYEVFLPQEDGALMADLIASGVDVAQANRMIFECDINALDEADILIAILDGALIDPGVAMEIGYCYAKGVLCLGVQSDFRRQLPSGNNPMIDGVFDKVFSTDGELIDYLNSSRS